MSVILSDCESAKLALYFATRDLFVLTKPEVEPDEIYKYMGLVESISPDESEDGTSEVQLVLRFRYGVNIRVPLHCTTVDVAEDLGIPYFKGTWRSIPEVSEDIHSYFYAMTAEGIQRLAHLAQTNPGLAKTLGI